MNRDASPKIIAACLAVCLMAGMESALAYRPFDATDASVADQGEREIEFGPVHFLREGPVRSFLAPAVVFNYGISNEREIVLEGKLQTFRDTPPEGHRTRLVDTALSLKQVHRRGVLQDANGPSVASECGVLLPTIDAEAGVGASCAGIVSQRWSAGTIHLNGALARTRESTWNRFFGAIVEGPYQWRVRPVLEVFRELDTSGLRVDSVLAGVIWRARNNLALDLGLREARANEQNISEVRAGFTLAF